MNWRTKLVWKFETNSRIDFHLRVVFFSHVANIFRIFSIASIDFVARHLFKIQQFRILVILYLCLFNVLRNHSKCLNCRFLFIEKIQNTYFNDQDILTTRGKKKSMEFLCPPQSTYNWTSFELFTVKKKIIRYSKIISMTLDAKANRFGKTFVWTALWRCQKQAFETHCRLFEAYVFL